VAYGARMTARLLVSTVALLLIVPATAAADSQEDASGKVAARITWVAGTDDAPAHGLRVTITRAGRQLVDDRVGDQPAIYPVHRKAVRVVDLDGDGEPEVLVDAFSGGAHCCERTRVYRFHSDAYSFTTHQWGNQAYDLRDLDGDGRLEFVSADDTFSYAFAAFAFSRWPVQIFEPRAGKLIERTRKFPGAVRRDLLRQRHAYRVARRHHDVVGPALGAYAADLHHLGRHAEARRIVRRALRRGELRRRHKFDLGPFGRAYVRELNRLLRRGGYLR
jgi:hypothetical protein